MVQFYCLNFIDIELLVKEKSYILTNINYVFKYGGYTTMELIIGLLVLSPFTALGIGFFALYSLYKKRLDFTFNYWTTGLLVLFFWSLIVSAINKSWLSAGGSILFLIYFFSSQLTSKKYITIDNLHKILNIVVKFTTIAAIIGIIEKIIFVWLGDGGHRIFSTFGNPNMTGSWFATIIVVAEYMVAQNGGKNNNWYRVSITLMIIALLFTGSRGAYVALAGTACLVAFIKGITCNKKMLFVTAIILAIVGVIAFAESKIISEYVTAHTIENSISPRKRIWSDGIEMLKNKPVFGWGVLSTIELGKEILPTYGRKTIHLHNLWLTLASTLGVIGLSIYIFMKYRLFKDLIFLFKTNKDLALLFLSINLIVIIQGFVDVSLYAPQLGIVFAWSGAFVANMVNNNKVMMDKSYIESMNSSMENKRVS